MQKIPIRVFGYEETVYVDEKDVEKQTELMQRAGKIVCIGELEEVEDTDLLPSVDVMVDLLSLVLSIDEMPELATVQSWTMSEWDVVRQWAGSVHLSASDNTDIKVPPRPDYLLKR